MEIRLNYKYQFYLKLIIDSFLSMNGFAKILKNLFSIKNEANNMMISNLYKHFQVKDSKFYFIDFFIHQILYLRFPIKEKLSIIFDSLLLFYNRTIEGFIIKNNLSIDYYIL